MAVKLRKTVAPPVGCPISTCMSLLGGVWTPEIIWSLGEGPRRFSELRRARPAVSAKVLKHAAEGPRKTRRALPYRPGDDATER